jgi:hypothetical protein
MKQGGLIARAKAMFSLTLHGDMWCHSLTSPYLEADVSSMDGSESAAYHPGMYQPLHPDLGPRGQGGTLLFGLR